MGGSKDHNGMMSGNQRDFARKVGCSQPLLSRIVTGKQEPGKELLQRIARYCGMDPAELLATLEIPLTFGNAATTIPVAQGLLDGSPATLRHELTTDTLTVAPTVYRDSLYAVVAKRCEPAFSDPSELMRGDDLLVIDSSMERVEKNLLTLNGRLCVVARRSGSNTITLRRVWVTFDIREKHFTVRTCPDAKVAHFRDSKFGNRQPRSIQLDDPETLPEENFVDQVINVNDIAGVAIELVRSL